MRSRLFAAVRGFVYAAVFVLLWTWVVLTVRSLDAQIAVTLPGALRIPGLIIAGLGLLLALSCVATFALAGRGTPAPFDAPREFVAVGPYRYVRNPMYVGALGVLFGAGLALRSPSILGVALGFWGLAHVFVIVYEEPTLEHRFGDSYRDFARPKLIYKHARNALEDGDHEWACFAAQQAAEKALKAVVQARGGESWGHSVTVLLGDLTDRLAVPEGPTDAGRRLDKHYIPTRYPNGFDAGAPTNYTAAEAEAAIGDAASILEFSRDSLG